MSSEKIIEGVSSVELMRPHPGDVIVVRSEHHLSKAEVDKLRAVAESVFGGLKVVVLEGGLSLQVVRRDDVPMETAS